MKHVIRRCVPSTVDVFRQQPQSSFRKIDDEEETAPSNKVATIAGHAGIFAC
jgi:hypothetical protein